MKWGKGFAGSAASIFFVLLTHPLRAAAPANDALCSQHNWKTFAALPQASAPIVFERVDLNLLSAAIFHETNRRRANHKLPPLAFDTGAKRAANLQAQIMAKTGDVSHENPGNPEYETLKKRVAAAGLHPRFAAENLAYTFAVQYRSGERVYVREKNGEEIFSYKPDGPPLAAHTYTSFAKSVVDQWMNAPGHRQNLLHREPTFLGVGCRPATGESGLPMIYCCQVFYAPLPVQN